MKSVVTTVLILLAITVLAGAQTPPPPHEGPVTPRGITKYAVRIGASYYEKWQPVFADSGAIFRAFIAEFKSTKGKDIPSFYYWLARNYGQKYYFTDFVKEMEVISELSGVPFEDIFIINFTYELFVGQNFIGCTSAVVANDAGQLIFGRNLDYSLMEWYSKIAIQFDYYEELYRSPLLSTTGQTLNRLVYQTSQFVGYVVVHTVVRPGAFAIALNERVSGYLFENLYHFATGAYPAEYLLLLVAQNAHTYSEAVALLKQEPIIASAYFIAAGGTPGAQNEACIIARNRNDVASVTQMNVSAGTWFLVQTNVDLKDPDKDTRRTIASERIAAAGRGITLDGLYANVMSLYPNFNAYTIETNMMDAQLPVSVFETTNWY